MDFCTEMIEIARQKLKKASNPHQNYVKFVMGNAKSLKFPDDSFDLVTVGFGMRNIGDTAAASGEYTAFGSREADSFASSSRGAGPNGFFQECGFTNIVVLPMTLGVATIFTVIKPLADRN